MVSCADQNETVPSPGACALRDCRHVRWLLGGPRGDVLRRSEFGLAVPVAANCETVATFMGCWEVQQSGVLGTPTRDLAAPRGAANCAIVATFVGCWEV